MFGKGVTYLHEKSDEDNKRITDPSTSTVGGGGTRPVVEWGKTPMDQFTLGRRGTHPKKTATQKEWDLWGTKKKRNRENHRGEKGKRKHALKRGTTGDHVRVLKRKKKLPKASVSVQGKTIKEGNTLTQKNRQWGRDAKLGKYQLRGVTRECP